VNEAFAIQESCTKRGRLILKAFLCAQVRRETFAPILAQRKDSLRELPAVSGPERAQPTAFQTCLLRARFPMPSLSRRDRHFATRTGHCASCMMRSARLPTIRS